jgi:hypothetical protein
MVIVLSLLPRFVRIYVVIREIEKRVLSLLGVVIARADRGNSWETKPVPVGFFTCELLVR